MPYIGNNHIVGDHINNFKVLDDISSYTATFDGSSTNVVSTSDETLRILEHRFVQGQRVTYNNGGGSNIGGLSSGTVYYVSFDTANTIKLATSLVNANNGTLINLTSAGGGTTHTLTAAFDGINTKFKLTHNGGESGRFNNATQLQVAINNVLQRPNSDPDNFTEGFAVERGNKIVFQTAPTSNDIFWGSIIANSLPTFDIDAAAVDNFTGDGSATDFTLSRIPPNNASIIVTINGVFQHLSDTTTARAYSLEASVVKFTSAPGSGDEIQVRHTGFRGALGDIVTGFYGRTGNVTLIASDDILTRNINSSGIITAASFSGDGSGLIGVASTDNIVTGTAATFNTYPVDINAGMTVAGVATFAGNVSIAGTLTYEDVKNVDSIGIITARNGIDCNGDLDVDGHTNLDNVSIAGVTTFTGNPTIYNADPQLTFRDSNHSPFYYYLKGRNGAFVIEDSVNGDRITFNANSSVSVTASMFQLLGASYISSNLSTGGTLTLPDSIIHTGDTDTKIRFPAADNISLETGGSERVRLNNSSFILKNSTNFGVGGYANPLQSGYNGAVIQLHQSQSGSSVGAQLRFTINDLGAGATDGMFLSYWGNKYFYLQQRETGGGYHFQNTDSSGTLSTPLTINSDSNIQIARDLDVDGHTNLDNVNIVGVATVTGEINIPDKSGSSNWITFGDGEDLKIWHSGTSGHLNNITGDLYIQGAPNNGSKVIIAAAGGGSDLARFTVGGGVNLYYNGSGRLSTRADGVRTYGTLEAANLNVTGVTTAVTVDVNGDLDVDGHTNLDNVSVAGVVTATSYYGDGANLSNVISGVDVKFEGASVGTGVTMLNFVGFNTVTAPASGLSTITSGQNLTIGVRSGSAVEASLTGTSFNVIARSGGNIAINI